MTKLWTNLASKTTKDFFQ